MLWPIPDIPEIRPLPRPDNKKLSVILLVMLTLGGGGSLFFGEVTSYGQIFLYGILPAFFVWSSVCGYIWLRYQQSVNNMLLWNKESEQTKLHWRHWCMRQWCIVGNVVLTAEENGVQALLGDYAKIPAYPQKTRPLHTRLPYLHHCFQYVDEQMEKQCPGYRHFLYTVKIMLAEPKQKTQVSMAIYAQWDLYPEYITSIDEALSDTDDGKTTLVICLQDWQSANNTKYSEFITAQLISPAEQVSQYALPVQAGLGRVLSSDDLSNALNIFSEYVLVPPVELHHIWLTGLNSEDRITVIQHASERRWQLPHKQPCHLIDHSFGPPGPLSFSLSVALMVDAAIHTEEIQLLISGQKESGYSLCLITRGLFS